MANNKSATPTTSQASKPTPPAQAASAAKAAVAASGGTKAEVKAAGQAAKTEAKAAVIEYKADIKIAKVETKIEAKLAKDPSLASKIGAITSDNGSVISIDTAKLAANAGLLGSGFRSTMNWIDNKEGKGLLGGEASAKLGATVLDTLGLLPPGAKITDFTVPGGALDKNGGYTHSSISKGVWSFSYENGAPVSVDPQSFTLMVGSVNGEVSDGGMSYSPVTIKKVVNSKTVRLADTKAAKMRQKDVLMYITGLKPFTSLYAFMDADLISNNVTSCEEVIISNASGTYHGVKEQPVVTTDIDVRVHGNTVYSYGEIISCSTGKAVVVANYTRTTSAGLFENVIYIVNRSGTLTGTLTGDISKVTSTFVSLNTPTTINTDSFGNYFGVVNVPADKYDAGTKLVKVTDNSGGNVAYAKTYAMKNYFSSGNIENYERSMDVQSVTEYYPSNWTMMDIFANNGYKANQLIQLGAGEMTVCMNDPLSQSFTLPAEFTSGAFIHSVDLYFYTKGTDTLPFTVQIVETVNGYPSMLVLDSVTLNHSSINADTTKLVPTRIQFNKLVFLAKDKEYAIKILSNSNKYKLWVSKMGEIDVTTKTLIAKQPSTGSLFMSQNNSTWTADQLRDLAFTLNYAKFKIDNAGVVDLYPVENTQILPNNPFRTFSGSTNVRVTHPNHGLDVGDYIKFYKKPFDSARGEFTIHKIKTGTNNLSTEFSGKFADSFKITSVTNSDSYVIQMASAAVNSESIGGSGVIVITQVKADTIKLVSKTWEPTKTLIAAEIRHTNSARQLQNEFSSVKHNRPIRIKGGVKILNTENETKHLNTNKSLTTRFVLTSTDSTMSPMIDIASVGFATGYNRVSPNTINNLIVDDQHLVYSGSTNTTVFNATNKTITLTVGSPDLSDITIGKSIVISGTSSNNGTFLITDIDYTGKIITVDGILVNETATNTATVKVYNMMISDISPNEGSSEFVYLTKQVDLKNASNGLHVIFDATIPEEVTPHIWYRAGKTGNLKSSRWYEISSTFIKSDDNMLERVVDITGLDDFTSFQIKITAETTDSTKIPIFKNLRAIATI